MGVMSDWLVGGRWVGFQFVRWPHPLPLYGSVRRYMLSPSPLLSFLLMISLLLLSVLFPLISPISDLLSTLYPPFSAPISKSRSVCCVVCLCVCVCVCEWVKPVGMESGIWQIACVQLGRISSYACQADSVHKDNSAMSITSTRVSHSRCSDGYKQSVWIRLPPSTFTQGFKQRKSSSFTFLCCLPISITPPFFP